MSDLISRQAAIDTIEEMQMPIMRSEFPEEQFVFTGMSEALNAIKRLPSAQPEQPPYVAEIEAEYQKTVKMPHIHKPLAKALYEVWKKHDREDAERRTDG